MPSEPTSTGHWSPAAGTVGLLCGAIALAVLTLPGRSDAAAGPLTAGARAAAAVTLSVSREAQPIPPSFFGLSIEPHQIAFYERAGSMFDRMISLIRSQNGAPLLLRVGGRTADQVYWGARPNAAASRVIELQPAWLDELASLVRRDRLRVELDLNAAVHSPTMAAAFARAAHDRLPAGVLVGVAIGNEPDLYRTQPWLSGERIPSTIRSLSPNWTESYGAASYVQEYRAYANALLRTVPNIAMTAPELTYPSLTWSTALLGLSGLRPRSLSFHRYATATCSKQSLKALPSPPGLLDERYTSGLARSLQPVISLAHDHGLNLRVTELNSIACGNRTEQTKAFASSFATALWAPDALFEMLRVGVAGINWHVRTDMPNAPFHIREDGVQAHPELYGLVAFAQMTGPAARLQTITTDAPRSLRLKAWGVRSTAGLKVLLINKGPRDVSTRLKAAADRQDALVTRLLGSAPASQQGVSFGGQTVGPDGRWQGRRVVSRIHANSGAYPITIPAYSAALVSIANANA